MLKSEGKRRISQATNCTISETMMTFFPVHLLPISA